MPKLVDHDERRARIAQAAMVEIAESGIESLRLTDVADRAGWTTGVLTHYFKNKQDLLDEALKRTLDALVGDAIAQAERFEGKLTDVLPHWLPTTPQRLSNWKTWLAFAGNGQFSARYRSAHQHYYRTLSELIVTQLQKEGGVGDLEQSADMLIAFLDGLSTRVVLEPHSWPSERQEALLAQYVRAVMR